MKAFTKKSTAERQPAPLHRTSASAAATSSASASRARARALSPPDEFAARRSGRRISSKKFTADNDTWHENLAVVELHPDGGGKGGGGGGGRGSKKSKRRSETAGNGAAAQAQAQAGDDAGLAAAQHPRLQIRSYFQSLRTGQRVWDEPPSGASSVVYATEEVRRMAEIQMQDLVVSTEVVGAARRAEGATDEEGEGEAELNASSGSGGGGVLGRLKFGRRRNGSQEKGGVEQPRERRRVTYKAGKAPYGSTAAFTESALDRDTQVAIMLSMGVDGRLVENCPDGSGGGGGRATPVGALSPRSGAGALSPLSGGGGGSDGDFEAELAMAKAISLSVAEAAKADLSPIAPPSLLSSGGGGDGRAFAEGGGGCEGEEERQLRMAMEHSMRLKMEDVNRSNEEEEEFLRASKDGGGGGSRAAAAIRPGVADGSGGGCGSQRRTQSVRQRGSSARGLSSSNGGNTVAISPSGATSPKNAALVGRNPFDEDDNDGDKKMPATAAAAAYGEDEDGYEYPPPLPNRARGSSGSGNNVPYGFKTKWDNKLS